jgi:hypothetical protein
MLINIRTLQCYKTYKVGAIQAAPARYCYFFFAIGLPMIFHFFSVKLHKLIFFLSYRDKSTPSEILLPGQNWLLRASGRGETLPRVTNAVMEIIDCSSERVK